MAIEKFWDQNGPVILTSNGNNEGRIEVLSAKNFFVKQQVILQSTALEGFFEVKAVIGPNILILGPRKTPLSSRADLSAFLVADSAAIRAEKQSRSDIPEKEYTRATFAEEPIVAWRNVLVDYFGDYYTSDNPLPVQLSDGAINIGSVNAELEVQLSHQDDVPNVGDVADSVQIGDGTDILQINPDGSINVTFAPVSTPKIVNINIPVANTEQSFALTATTKRFKIRIRDGKAKLRLAFAVGESGTNFWTVERGAWYEDNDIDASGGITLYFQATHASVDLEIQYWET